MHACSLSYWKLDSFAMVHQSTKLASCVCGVWCVVYACMFVNLSLYMQVFSSCVKYIFKNGDTQ